jgi:hypothetical protein
MAWAGVGEKQVVTVVTQLVGLGLVERVTIGRVGRRAEYRVFPHGVPPYPSTEELIERRRAAQRAPTNPRLARKTARRKPSAAARTQQDVTAREEARSAVEGGSEPGLPQGNPDDVPSRVAPEEPSGLPQGNRAGSPVETPSLPPSSSSLPHPPTPAADAAGTPGAVAGRSSGRAARSTPSRWGTAGGAARTRVPGGRRRGARRPTAPTVNSRTGCGSSSPSRNGALRRPTLRPWRWPVSGCVTWPAWGVRKAANSRDKQGRSQDRQH